MMVFPDIGCGKYAFRPAETKKISFLFPCFKADQIREAVLKLPGKSKHSGIPKIFFFCRRKTGKGGMIRNCPHHGVTEPAVCGVFRERTESKIQINFQRQPGIGLGGDPDGFTAQFAQPQKRAGDQGPGKPLPLKIAPDSDPVEPACFGLIPGSVISCGRGDFFSGCCFNKNRIQRC